MRPMRDQFSAHGPFSFAPCLNSCMTRSKVFCCARVCSGMATSGIIDLDQCRLPEEGSRNHESTCDILGRERRLEPDISERHSGRDESKTQCGYQMARRARVEIGAPPPAPDVVCPLCDRPIPRHARSSRHHLIPKLKGGARLGTVLLHQICHSAIHARFSEAELARRLNDVSVLKVQPELAEFLAWVRTKPNDFHAPTRMTADRLGARRRRST